MDILVNVTNQQLRIVTNLKNIVAGTQEFIRFVYNFADDWNDLTIFAQFTQNDVSYNQFLDNDNTAYLPSEIDEGTVTMKLYGSGGDVIAVTDAVTLKVSKNVIQEDGESTVITLSLYNQIINRMPKLEDDIIVFS